MPRNMGRPKGAKNKHTFKVEDIAQKYALEPFEFAMAVLNGDWKTLGFKEESKISYTNAGIEFEEPHIKMSERVKCAEFAGKYLYSPKQPVNATGSTAITVEVVDYTKGK